MSLSRPLRLVALAGVLCLLLAACGGTTAAVWTYAPAPSPTPTPPDQPSVLPTVAPSTNPDAITIAAQNFAFSKQTLLVPSGQPFQISFTNNDSGVGHNIQIKDANGQILFDGAVFNGVATQIYDVPQLGTGDYTFVCKIHANMQGTITAGQ